MTRAGQLADARRCLREARAKLAKLERAQQEAPSALADLRVFHARRAADLWAADVSRLRGMVRS